MKGLIKFTLLLGLLSGFISIAAQDETELQKAEELEKSEETIDKKIAEYNEMLAQYNTLNEGEVELSPVQTKFTKTDDYIELESYDFIQDNFSPSVVVGGKVKSMKLYFSGDKLARVESTIVKENFQEKIKITSIVTDPDPMSVENGDIEIMTQTNNEEPHRVKLENMENTLSNPTRLKFKREFYLRHLRDFERLYRYTKQYKYQYGSNNDYNTVEKLKESLKY